MALYIVDFTCESEQTSTIIRGDAAFSLDSNLGPPDTGGRVLLLLRQQQARFVCDTSTLSECFQTKGGKVWREKSKKIGRKHVGGERRGDHWQFYERSLVYYLALRKYL